MKGGCFKGCNNDSKVAKKREDTKRQVGSSNRKINYRAGGVVGCERKHLWHVAFVVFDCCSHQRSYLPKCHSNQSIVRGTTLATHLYGYLCMNGMDNHDESKTTNLYSSFYIKAKFNCTEFIFSIIYTQLKCFSLLRGHFNQR